jgi:copper chaperone CopZ
MKSTFTIDGMTCSGCAAKVTYTLQQIDSVSEVAVDLDAKQATLTAERSIDLTEVASELAPFPKYSVTASAPNAAASGLKPIHWRTYWPLILIGLFISVVTTGITWQTTGTLTTWMEYFMGGFFLVFSFFKFLDIRGFAASYRSYDLLAKAVPAYGFIYPFLELALGLAWAFEGGTYRIALSTVVLMGFSAIGVIAAVTRKQQIQCACLGTVFNLPMSTVTIIEDLLMVVMAGAFLIP